MCLSFGFFAARKGVNHGRDRDLAPDGGWYFGTLGLGLPGGSGNRPWAGAEKAGKSKRRAPEEAMDTLAVGEPMATRVLTTAERDAYLVLRKACQITSFWPKYRWHGSSRCPPEIPMPSGCAALARCAQTWWCAMPRRKSLRWSKFANPLHVKRAHRTPPYPHGPGADRRTHSRACLVGGALPGHAIAREAILGAAVNTVTH